LSPPFDVAAPTYDAEFTHTHLARWLRDSVQAHLATVFHPGDRVLELGCGTGEDALWLAHRGVRVTATDVSLAMLDVAQHKAAAAGLADLIDFAAFDLISLPSPIDNSQFSIDNSPFSGAFSNFGPLNCLLDRRHVAAALGGLVRTGGQVVLVLMAPVCPWEIGWHLLHGQVQPAFRRFRRGAAAHVGDGKTIRVWYPSPHTLAAEFAPYFELRKLVGIGSLLPPSYLSNLVDRRPVLFERLARAERRAGTTWPWTWLNDHYLMVLERR
jgi:SAM-dependent methyltransferase